VTLSQPEPKQVVANPNVLLSHLGGDVFEALNRLSKDLLEVGMQARIVEGRRNEDSQTGYEVSFGEIC
jgi:hypothetical protein